MVDASKEALPTLQLLDRGIVQLLQKMCNHCSVRTDNKHLQSTVDKITGPMETALETLNVDREAGVAMDSWVQSRKHAISIFVNMLLLITVFDVDYRRFYF